MNITIVCLPFPPSLSPLHSAGEKRRGLGAAAALTFALQKCAKAGRPCTETRLVTWPKGGGGFSCAAAPPVDPPLGKGNSAVCKEEWHFLLLPLYVQDLSGSTRAS